MDDSRREDRPARLESERLWMGSIVGANLLGERDAHRRREDARAFIYSRSGETLDEFGEQEILRSGESVTPRAQERGIDLLWKRP